MIHFSLLRLGHARRHPCSCGAGVPVASESQLGCRVAPLVGPLGPLIQAFIDVLLVFSTTNRFFCYCKGFCAQCVSPHHYLCSSLGCEEHHDPWHRSARLGLATHSITFTALHRLNTSSKKNSNVYFLSLTVQGMPIMTRGSPVRGLPQGVVVTLHFNQQASFITL